MVRSFLFKPLKNRKKIFEQISDQVREVIFSGILKPGDKLPPEKQLASQFNTGRMVVREALRTLEQSGLVHIKQGSLGGAFVKNPDTTVMTRSISDLIKIGHVTLGELTEARLGIEKVILGFAMMRMNSEDLNLLKKNIEDSEEKFLRGERRTKDHMHFHILLAKLTKNLLFEMIIESMMDVTKSFVEPDVKHINDNEIKYINNVLTYHKKIYKALKEKNLHMAEQIMEKHLLDVSRKLKDVAQKMCKR